MAKYKCAKCGYDRTLRSDGWLEECSNCGAPEHDVLREALDEYEK